MKENRLCVVLPALNEEKSIEDVLKAIPRDIPTITDIDIVVVDDGSTDKTSEIAKAQGAHVVRHTTNKGVGAAFRSGVDKAIELGADFMVNIDADGQFDPKDIPTVLQPLLDKEAEFASASRFMKKDFYPVMSKVKFYGNHMMSWLISTLTGKKYYDVSCGFRAYSREVLLRLNLFGDFTYTQETFLDLSMKQILIKEVPIKLVCGTRQFGKSRVASNLWRYAINTSKIIFRAFRDYKPMIVFGSIGAILSLFSFFGFAFIAIRYGLTGHFSPYKWVAMTSGFLAAIGLLVFVTSLIADMLARIRLNQERILYMLKKQSIHQKVQLLNE